MLLSLGVTWVLPSDSKSDIASLFESLKQTSVQNTKDNKPLPTLTLGLCYLNNEQLTACMEGLASVLMTGMISGVAFLSIILNSPVTPESLDLLFNLVSAIPSLVTIDWTTLDLSISATEQEESLRAVAKMVRRARNLGTLHFVSHACLGVTQQVIVDFANAISEHPSLKNFVFGGNGPAAIQSFNINPILTALTTVPHLATLGVHSNAVADVHPNPFLKFCDHPSLKFLNMDANSIAFHRIHKSLVNSQSLTHLMLANRITTNECGLIGEIIRDNRILQALLLSVMFVQDGRNSIPIIDALKVNSTLKTVHFLFAGLESFGVEIQDRLVSMHARNFTVTAMTLKASENDTCPTKYNDVNAKLSFYSKLNEMGRKTLLSNQTKNMTMLADFLVLHRDDLNVLFYYLSVVPELISK